MVEYIKTKMGKSSMRTAPRERRKGESAAAAKYAKSSRSPEPEFK